MSAYEPVIGLEIHAQLLTASKIFCGCSDGVRRRAQYAPLPGLPRPAGRAAGPQPRRGRLRDPRGARARLHDSGDLDLRPQELLLSGPAEGLSDFAVRAAARDRRRRRGAQRLLGAGLRHPHHARAHGRGRREAPARGLSGFRAPQLRRSEPRGHAAHRNRHRAGPAHGEGRRRVLQRTCASCSCRARRQRRQHGGGQPALRRQRVGTAGRRRSRSARKPRSRTSTRSGFSRRPSITKSNGRSTSSSGRPRRPGDAALGQRAASARCRCAARKKRTTIAISRSRICRRSSSTPRGSQRLRRTIAGAAGRARAATAACPRLLRCRGRAADAGGRARGRISKRPLPPAPTRKAVKNWLLGAVRAKMNEAGERRHRHGFASAFARRLAGLLAPGREGHDQRLDGQGRLREDVRDRADAPTRSSAPKA